MRDLQNGVCPTIEGLPLNADTVYCMIWIGMSLWLSRSHIGRLFLSL